MKSKTADSRPLACPFPYYGGKRLVTDLVWQALGKPRLYVEPFFGSGAVFLARPDDPGREIINDIDGFVVNFWRSIRSDPDKVAYHAGQPVSEIDLIAWHRWICARRRKNRFLRRMLSEPDYCDAKIAGIWCWGQSIFMGTGWCDGEWFGAGDKRNHGPCAYTCKKPRLKPSGVIGLSNKGLVQQACRALHERLRHAIVLCGDWSRCFMPSDLAGRFDVGIFLDPPYAHATGRDPGIYNHEMADTSGVEAFCREHGGSPRIRIVLAGFEGEYRLPGWRVVKWTRRMAHARGKQAVANQFRERLWISPHCLPVRMVRSTLPGRGEKPAHWKPRTTRHRQPAQ